MRYSQIKNSEHLWFSRPKEKFAIEYLGAIDAGRVGGSVIAAHHSIWPNGQSVAAPNDNGGYTSALRGVILCGDTLFNICIPTRCRPLDDKTRRATHGIKLQPSIY